ncbi:MAG: toprim domain-containing protein [Oligoflexus sp.]
MAIQNDLINHSSEIESMARDCGIDWLSVSNLSSGVHKNPPVISAKYKGKSVLWVEEKTTRSGKEFIKITFHTKKHGGVTRSWNSLAQGEFRPKLTPRRIGDDEKDRLRRKEQFLAYRNAFNSVPKPESFTYLRAKGIDGIQNLHDIRLLTDNKVQGKAGYSKPFIAFPLFSPSGSYVGLQRIYEDGSKKLTTSLAPGQYRGAHSVIGEPTDIIYVTEGFATAAAIYLATGKACVFSYSAGNLDMVTSFIKSRYEDAKVFIAADNDLSENGNTGVFKALEAAKNNRVKVLVPPAIDDKKSDWNDIFCAFGAGFLESALSNKAYRLSAARGYVDYLFQLLGYAKNQEIKGLVKKIAASTRVPFLISAIDLCEKIAAVLGKRANRAQILKAIRSVEVASRYKAREVSGISPKSVDELKRFETVMNTEGHWVISEDATNYMMDELEQESIVILKSPMGTGKTERATKKAMDRVSRSALVLPRISIVNDASDRLNVDHYRNIDEILAHFTDKMVTCINSLGAPRFQAENGVSWFEGLDLLCLDEASQSLPQVIQLGKASRRKKNYDVLAEAMTSAKSVLVADADANEYLVGELKRLSPERRIVVIDVSHPEKADKSLDIHFTDSTAEARDSFIQAALGGEKCLLATDNKRKALEIERLLLTVKPELRILNIHREPKKADLKKVTDFYNNPNKACRDYDVLIYSPAITSGVSLTTEHFSCHVGIFTGVIKVNDILQMIGRDRTARDWLLAISGRSQRASDYDMERALSELGEAPTDFSRLKASTDIYEADARNGLIMLALNILEIKGHRIQLAAGLEEKLGASIKSLSSEISKQLSEERIERILSQVDISEAQYQMVKRKWLQTEEEAAAVYAYKIRHYLCADLSRESIDFMDQGGLSKLAMFETFMAERSDLRRFDTNEALEKDPSQRFYAAKKQSTLRKILEILSLDENLCGEFTHRDSQKVVDYFLENYDLVNQLFPNIISREKPPRCATSFVARIFEMMGLRLGKRKSHGRMIRFIDRASLAEMSSYATARRQQDQSFPNLAA